MSDRGEGMHGGRRKGFASDMFEMSVRPGDNFDLSGETVRSFPEPFQAKRYTTVVRHGHRSLACFPALSCALLGYILFDHDDTRTGC